VDANCFPQPEKDRTAIRGKQHADIADAVVDQPALAARIDQPLEPQTRKLLRDHRLLYAENILDFAHRPLFTRQYAEDQKSGLVRQRFQKMARFVGFSSELMQFLAGHPRLRFRQRHSISRKEGDEVDQHDSIFAEANWSKVMKCQKRSKQISR
jgi:hypothetical protein